MALDLQKLDKGIEEIQAILRDKIEEMKSEEKEEKKKDKKDVVQYGGESFVEHDGRLISSKKLQSFSVLQKPDEAKDDPFEVMLKERISKTFGS